MENQTSTKRAVTLGIAGGLVSVIYTLILYLFGAKYITGFWTFINYVIFIVFMVIAGVSVKKDSEGYISFKEALKPIFIVAVIAVAILTIFNYVLYNYIDPQLPEVLKRVTLERTIHMMEKFGAPESAIEKATDQIQNKDFSMTIKSSMLSLAGSFIFGFIISAIIAAIIKKNRPLFVEEEGQQSEITEAETGNSTKSE